MPCRLEKNTVLKLILTCPFGYILIYSFRHLSVFLVACSIRFLLRGFLSYEVTVKVTGPKISFLHKIITQSCWIFSKTTRFTHDIDNMRVTLQQNSWQTNSIIIVYLTHLLSQPQVRNQNRKHASGLSMICQQQTDSWCILRSCKCHCLFLKNVVV